MSGNSCFSIPHTVPIVSNRLFETVAISAIQEGEAVLADLELVAVLELRALDTLAVDERAVETPLVLDRERAVRPRQDGVLARDGDVVEEDPAVRRAADRRLLRFGAERLPRPATAGSDDERGAFDPEVLERSLRRAVAFLRRERLRRLGAGLVLDEQRAAPRAVVGGLRVLEPALL